MKFSVRETKRLKRILRNECCNKPIDYVQLQYGFPGKSVQAIKETSKMLNLGRRKYTHRKKEDE